MKVLLTIFLVGFTVLWGQVPRQINYQGYLTDNTGIPVDSTNTLTFRFYDAESGGDLKWTDTQENIQIDAGFFNAVIGKGNPIPLDFGEPYWITVQVGTGNEIEPRMRLTSSAYSMNAANAEDISDNAVTESKIQDGAVTSSKINISAGGDLSGDYPNPTVNKLQGKPMSIGGTLTSGHVLKWNGTAWTPLPDETGEGSTVNVTSRLKGDGSAGNPLDIASQSAANGQVLKWDGSAWTPDDDVAAGPANGDLTGTYPDPGIKTGAVNSAKIENRSIQAEDISQNTITANELATGSVTTTEIQNGTIQTNDIAPDAVTNDRILDEPGIAYKEAQDLNLANHNNPQQVDSLSMTPPANGYIVVEASGYVVINHNQGQDDLLMLNVLRGGETDLLVHGLYVVTIPGTLPSNNAYAYPFTCRRVVQVNMGVAETFTLFVEHSTGGIVGDTNVLLPVIVARFYSTSYRNGTNQANYKRASPLPERRVRN